MVTIINIAIGSPEVPGWTFVCQGQVNEIGTSSPGMYNVVVSCSTFQALDESKELFIQEAKLAALKLAEEEAAAAEAVSAENVETENNATGDEELLDEGEGDDAAVDGEPPAENVEGEKENGGATDEASGPVIIENLLIGVMLDGRTVPDPSDMALIKVYDSLKILTDNDAIAVPKGGAILGTEQLLAIEQSSILSNGSCIVRIRGINDESIDCEGVVTVLDENDDLLENVNITFTIPDSLDTLEGENREDEIYYPVDFSIDNGAHFETADKPILQIFVETEEA
jgi:hypothetical protein